MSFASLISNVTDKYPKPQRFHDTKVSYGTAGFRTKAEDLDWVLYRMGMLAVMRSLCMELKGIGCMITASHNPECDNGCKLVDPMGDMLEEKWETYATQLVNSNDIKETLTQLATTDFQQFIAKYDTEQNKATVIVAHDTRPSCALLLDAFSCGVQDLNGSLINYGLLTTPQLHYMVRCRNTNGLYGEASEQGYYDKLSKAFGNIWQLIEFKKGDGARYEPYLFVDGANGIGADKMKIFKKILKGAGNTENQLDITIFNDGKASDDVLNHMCGADHVKVGQKPPVKLPESVNPIGKYCSFDGDADRIVYYYLNEAKKFRLLDGDKIATLLATHMTDLLSQADLKDKIKLCIVQTAYANGSSTDFIENVMHITASCTPTGVKHLHHEAQKSDIGIYFEANGHGTVIFSEHADSIINSNYKSQIEQLKFASPTDLVAHLASHPHLQALYVLKNLKDCINETVGDAITDLLAVELILALRNLSIKDWDGLYTDLPSRQLKVTIKDRNVIKTTDAERRVSRPIELQAGIDKLIKDLGYKSARSFVRASGTEDVVRVYAEADSQEHTDELAGLVCGLVWDLAGGVGPRPV